jgi:hypothetical protein
MSLKNQSYRYYLLLSERSPQPWVRFVALFLYYLGILVALLALSAKGTLATPSFIYQNF